MSSAPVVSIATIAERLHVSRNFIRISMLPHIKHKKTAQYRVQVDEMELRQWLVENSEFSRQTQLIPLSYDTLTGTNTEERRNNVPPYNFRKELPFRCVKPFDYWDLPLLFPNDNRFAHAESFYRAMYACGAIKIKLGKRKSIFYAPELTEENLVSAESFESSSWLPRLEMRQGAMVLKIDAKLCPAEDEGIDGEHKARIPVGSEEGSDSVALSIGIRGKNSQYVEEVTRIIFEQFPSMNIHNYNDGKSVQLTIPQKAFGKRK